MTAQLCGLFFFFSLSDVVHWVKEVLVLVGLPVSSRMSGLPGRLSKKKRPLSFCVV